MIGALAEQIDRDHGLGFRPSFLAVAMPRSSDARVDVEGRFVDIDE